MADSTPLPWNSGGDAEDDAEDTVAGFADFQLPHQAELLDQPEFAVELPDDAVQVGHGDEESDRFVVEIGEKMMSGSIIGFMAFIICIASSCAMGLTPEKSAHALL